MPFWTIPACRSAALVLCLSAPTSPGLRSCLLRRQPGHCESATDLLRPLVGNMLADFIPHPVRSREGEPCWWRHVCPRPDRYSAKAQYPGMNIQITATLSRRLAAAGLILVHGARHDAHAFNAPASTATTLTDPPLKPCKLLDSGVAAIARTHPMVAGPRSAWIGWRWPPELLPVAEGVCCRRSEDEDQFPKVSWLHLGAQGQRGSSRIIEEDAQGARPVLGLVQRGVSGQLPGGRIEVVRSISADSVEPRWRSEARQGAVWCAH
jgi:hypothetical protein